MEEVIKKSIKEAKASIENAAKEIGKSLDAVASAAKDTIASKLPAKTREHLEKSGEELRMAAKTLALGAIEKTEGTLRDLKGRLTEKNLK